MKESLNKNYLVFFIAFGFLLASALLFIPFMAFHEQKYAMNGLDFNDPFFTLLPAYDCSIAIFSLTYLSLIYFIFTEFKVDFRITQLMIVYGLILFLRIVSMSMLPFKSIDGLIFLRDPFLNEIIYPGNITTDLFFSGHTALLFSFYLLSKKKVFIYLSIILGVLLMIQRNHYSIDILAAYPFAWLSFYISGHLLKLFRKIIL